VTSDTIDCLSRLLTAPIYIPLGEWMLVTFHRTFPFAMNNEGILQHLAFWFKGIPQTQIYHLLF